MMKVKYEVLADVRFWISGQNTKFLNPEKNSHLYLPSFFLQLGGKKCDFQIIFLI